MTNQSQFSQSLREWMETFTHRSMHDWARFVKASGFSMPQFFLLMHVRRHSLCGVSKLSEGLDITPAAASQLVDKLVQAGLLIRAEDPHDRRARQLALTEAGRELIERGVAERYRWVDDVAKGLSEAEQSQVSAALAVLARAASAAGLEPLPAGNSRE
jgi:DNA-binding MarR family transcriptional regulator